MGLLRSIVAALRSALPSSTSSEESEEKGDPRHWLGRKGEDAAARELRRMGFKVLYRNFRAPQGGEVDIVCREGDVLVFVEVKTRSSEEYGRPLEAVTEGKQALILRGALAWLRLLGHPEIPIRFDIVEVQYTGECFAVHLVRNAFTPPERYRF